MPFHKQRVGSDIEDEDEDLEPPQRPKVSVPSSDIPEFPQVELPTEEDPARQVLLPDQRPLPDERKPKSTGKDLPAAE